MSSIITDFLLDYLVMGNFTCSNNTNILKQDGETPLWTASFSGHRKVVEILLAAWANPNLQRKVRKTIVISIIIP